jgi:hypothetical protein
MGVGGAARQGRTATLHLHRTTEGGESKASESPQGADHDND